MSFENCPFCSPNISKACFAESANFRAIYNLAPILPGHVLIIPNKHITNFLSIEDSMFLEMIQLSKRVIKVLNKAFSTNSFNWTLQEGISAGQSVEHLHIHIIPRKKGDLPNPGDWYPELISGEMNIIDSLKRPQLSDFQMQSVINYLKRLFSS